MADRPTSDPASVSPPNPSERGALFDDLANTLLARYRAQGNRPYLDRAVELHRRALNLRPPGHPDRVTSLNNLGVALLTRFSNFGSTVDLDEAIASYGEGLTILPTNHPARSSLVNNLATVLRTRFEQNGNISDLDTSVALHRQAVAVRQKGHPDRPMSLNNLANALSTRFQQLGDHSNFDEALALHYEALELRPKGHPDRGMSLKNIADALKNRFDEQGNVADLREAITYLREALDLYPQGHSYHGDLLSSLGNSLHVRFKHLGTHDDLGEAIALHREALMLRPQGHTARALSLSNLANTLRTRFDLLEDRSDLDEAIALHREALSIRAPGHPDRAASFVNLANSIWARFRRLRSGDPVDLDEAILLLREALVLFRSPNSQLGGRADLDEAIGLLREALGLRPAGHPTRETSLNNLANVLDVRARRTSNSTDLDEAIALHREALSLRSTGHPERGHSLGNLATVLETRYELSGHRADLDELVRLSEEHVREHPGAWVSLGRLAGVKSQPQSYYSNPADAVELLSQLLCSPLGSTQRLLHQAVSRLGELGTANVLDDGLRRRLVDVYRQAIGLMPQAAYLGLGLSQRLRAIIDAEPAATMAASHALRLHDIPTALILLEQGRAVFWQQALRLRAPPEKPQVPDGQYSELVQLFEDLNTEPLVQEPQSRVSMEVDAASRWKKSKRLEELLQDVHNRLDTEAQALSLLAPGCTSLLDVGDSGPVVVLLSTPVFSGAIIIKEGRQCHQVDLPSDTIAWLKSWNSSWKHEIKEARSYLRDYANGMSGDKHRGARLVGLRGGETALLKQLWDYLVAPIIIAVFGQEVCFVVITLRHD
ncbi:hypothetical protein FOMPIDRAFT_90731 [Fomitopsis schrenkii]|uniref:CHAT domain-containing protein n=1 Tax=Fomitopsis schrenkii TaxID=2126942 RepID=S8FF41_FOMSC|nr:hypothetical protein FOMPIDRAFT_90731 [Fomitopsis schrenkii]